MSSSSPPPPPPSSLSADRSAFNLLRARAPSIAEQIEKASVQASPDDSSIADLYKIRWKNRRFVLESQLSRKTSRGRRSWISAHGDFLAELKEDDTVKAFSWSCTKCDANGRPQIFNAQSTSAAMEHLRKYVMPWIPPCIRKTADRHREHRIIESSSHNESDDPSSVLDLQEIASLKRPARAFSNIPRSKVSRIRELSIGCIIENDLPFTTLSRPVVQELLHQFNHALAEQVPWSRSTLIGDLQKLFETARVVIQEQIATASTCIHFSFDLWTSPNRQAYIAVFAHFLDQKYHRQNILIAFRRQLGCHSGENIADTLEKIIQEWGFGSRLGTGMSDNVTTNDTCLQSLFPRYDLMMQEGDITARRMRCFGHILNLVAKAFLYGEDSDAFELQDDFYELHNQYDQALQHWRRKGPIGKLHNIVKFIRSSPQRTEAFKKAAKEQDASTLSDGFTLAEESSRELELKMNNATRWNSTYLMIKRAWKMQSDIQAYIMTLDVTGNGIPVEDRLTVEDWRLLGEILQLLKPLYTVTMLLQGWAHKNDHGQLWEVMTSMEFLLDHFEDWKLLYNEEPADLAADLRASPPGLGLGSPPTRRGERPVRQSRPPRHLEGYELSTPSQRQPGQRASRFNEAALPEHTQAEYTNAQAVSMIENMQENERAYMRASINNAWLKLDYYYTKIGESPLYAAATILHPGLGLRFLEANWTSSEQLQWLRDAKLGLKAYFEKWYAGDDDPTTAQAPPPSPMPPPPSFIRIKDSNPITEWVNNRLPQLPDAGDELERYYRLERVTVDNPIQWWVDHKGSFPQLSRLALDILAIPPMSTDCERAFSIAKLTFTSQRHTLQEATVQMLQLLKNWFRHCGIKIGGVAGGS